MNPTYVNQPGQRGGGGGGGPTLNTITLANGPLEVGVPKSGSLVGQTAGSLLFSNLSGLTVDGTLSTYSWDGTGPFGPTPAAITEVNAGSPNTPKNNPLFVTRAEANLYIAALPTTPNAARQVLIQQLYQDLLVGTVNGTNVYGNLDYMHRIACEDSANALIDMVRTGTIYNGSPVNSPVFTVDRQYATDGISSYVDEGFNPSGSGRKYVQNSCSFFIWNRREGQSTASAAGWYNTVTPSGTTLLLRSATDTSTARANQDGVRQTGTTITSALGLTGVNRNASQATDTQIYKNGVLQALSGGAISGAIESGNFRLGAITATNFGSRDFACSGAGQSLNANQWADLYAALSTYMTAIGA